VPFFQWYRERLPLQLRARKRVSGSDVAAKELAELEMRKPSRKRRATRRKTAIGYQLSAENLRRSEKGSHRLSAISYQLSAFSLQQGISAAPCFSL
jgi:hypothetical protein